MSLMTFINKQNGIMNRTILAIILFFVVGNTFAQDDTNPKGQGKFLQEIYDEFRAEVIIEYTEFMEQAWKNYGMKEPIPFL